MLSQYNFSAGYTSSRNSGSLFGRIDIVALGLYFALVLVGILCITSASYDPEVGGIFSFKHNYVKQIMWAGISWVVALVVLLLERRYFHMFAYPAFIVGILLLLTCFTPIGDETNGARAWLKFGSIKVQPVEFAKIATALMLARVMSDYSFNINRLKDLFKVAGVILIPLAIIILQNDTGSGLVLCSFLFVFIREGITKFIYFPLIFTVFLFIASFIFTTEALFTTLIIAFTIYNMLKNGAVGGHISFLALIFLAVLLLCVLTPMSGYTALMVICSIAVVILGFIAIKMRAMSLLWPIIMFVYAMLFVPTTDFMFSKLKPHQQDRILTFVGVKSDPQGIDYNVNQSLIAIGSGGMFGKGFMDGTQIKYDYVPEKHTDFIFCTVGEEWGFMGTTFVVMLYVCLILRLMRMGERIKEPFGRVYCYSVASILLFHVWVNIGMTIGLMPVMGIPLPLMSYGGSSLVASTILIMIAIRLDASTEDDSVYVG
ncbi:MAG: rod shape-determining protein RodA [Alistipes sp.]|nr:rod shape-determining protein RodA [Alistipes sp.]